MKEKIIDWFYFHVEILKSYKFPYFVWAIGLIAMFVAQHIYPKIIHGIYDFQLLGNFPFKSIIAANVDFLRHGMWLVPMVVLGYFVILGIQIHQKNIQRVYRF